MKMPRPWHKQRIGRKQCQRTFSSSAKVSTNPFSANLDAQYIERLGRPKYPLMDDIKTTFG